MTTEQKPMPDEIFIQWRDRTREAEHEFKGNQFRVSDTDTKYIRADRAESLNRQTKDAYTPKFGLFDRVKLSHHCKYQYDWKDAHIIIGEVKYNRKLDRVEYAIYDMNEPEHYGFTDGFLEHDFEHYTAAEQQLEKEQKQ
jgi:hypothetical protein